MLSFSHLFTMPITELCQPIRSAAVNSFFFINILFESIFCHLYCSTSLPFSSANCFERTMTTKKWHWSNHLVLCTHFHFMPHGGELLSALNKNWMFNALLFCTIYLSNSRGGKVGASPKLNLSSISPPYFLWKQTEFVKGPLHSIASSHLSAVRPTVLSQPCCDPKREAFSYWYHRFSRVL